MPATLDAVLPIFAVIAAGWVLAALRAVPRRIGDWLSSFAGQVGIPVLIFRTVVRADFGLADPWEIWGCYFPAVALAWWLGGRATALFDGGDPRKAVIGGVGSAFANTVFVGLPLAERAYGEHGAVIVTLLISIHLPVMMTAATLLMERAERLEAGLATGSVRGTLAAIGRALLTNPIVLALIAGTVVRLSGVPLAGVPMQVIDVVAKVAGPAALVALGMSLHHHGLKGDIATTFAVTGLKIVVLPAIVLAICVVFRIEPETTRPLVVLAGVPAGVNVFLIADRAGVGQPLASGVVAMTTFFGAATSAAWIALLGRIV